MSEEAIFQRRFNREKLARKAAEKILEQKSLELYNANVQLKSLNENLEHLIAERTQALRKSQLRLSTLIANLHSGILLEDENRRVVVTNRFFCEIFSVDAPPEALVGADCREPAEMAKFLFIDPDAFMNRVNELIEYREPCVEEELYMKNGRVLERDYIPVFAGEKYLGHLWQYRDVTMRKIELQELEDAKQVAEDAQKAEKQFLASMSHEIRTPLNAVIGMSNLLYDTRPTPEQVEYLDIIQTSTNILQSLISDILDLSKIEAGRIEYNEKPVDLVGLIRALQKTFQIKMGDKPVEVEAFVDTAIENYILSDQMLINQIFLNLLGNAEKFTAEGHIGLQIKIAERNEDEITLKCKVYDSGIGIDESRLNAIFEKFKQASSEVRVKYGGTGLGLPITKKLIEFLGGNISVTSEVGRGTTFLFTLKVKDAGFKTQGLTTKPHTTGREFNLEKIKILVVEDNEMNRRYLKGLFKRWNVAYDMAINGKEALAVADRERFDLILMDIQMPVMNGYDATIAIRNSHNPNKNTPIVALTASALMDQREKALSLGMNGHITKPFTPNQLKDGIYKYVIIDEEDLDNSPKSDTDLELEGIEQDESAFVLELVEEPPIKSEFVFSDALNTEYLQEFFEEDLEYATDMFESFFKSTVPDIPLLKSHLEAKEWEKLGKLAHKIGPTFSIIGLTDLEPLFRKIEKMIDLQDTRQELEELVQNLLSLLPDKIDLIQSELDRMKAW